MPSCVTLVGVGAQAGPVWVQIATSQPVVELGLRTMLETSEAPFAITTAGPPEHEPDVVLYDVILMREGDTTDLDAWLKETSTTVVAVDRTLRPELGAQARTRGVEWGITLGITGPELVQVIEEAISGTLEDSSVAQEWDTSEHLGQDVGLSRRESEVLQLVLQGLSNQEIAEAMFLSINSVKSYIRSAYRKIEVNSRSQAVIWGMNHGFASPQQEPEDDAVPE
jgi:DNA-binding NarL/FixJ family response regulator